MTRGWPIMAMPVMLESPRRVVEGAVAAMKSKGEGVQIGDQVRERSRLLATFM